MSSDDKLRQKEFRRNTDLEGMLSDINASLWLAEKELLVEKRDFVHPVIFVMGPMRSGTTLFMQWLANTGLVAYPTNLLSRFYRAPVIGAKIQLMLTDPRYSFRDELGDFSAGCSYVSENGKTSGVLSPNEFWYFWRRFLPETAGDSFSSAELERNVDRDLLRAELAGLVEVFNLPMAFKGMLFNYNIDFLSRVFDKAIFVHLSRDVLSNAQSVLSARERQLGSIDSWYSFRIKEYEQLKSMSPVYQVVGQVQCINRAVAAGFSDLPAHRKLVVNYEEFCRKPEAVYKALDSLLKQHGSRLEESYSGEHCFSPSLEWKRSEKERLEALEAIEFFSAWS